MKREDLINTRRWLKSLTLLSTEEQEKMADGKKWVKTERYGTAYLKTDGYYYVGTYPDTVALHRVIWEDVWQSSIPDKLIVHHWNGDKTDNRPVNLYIMNRTAHNHVHRIGVNNTGRTRYDYFTIVKHGKSNNKQIYALMKNQEIYKSNYDPEKLREYFIENFPLEILKYDKY